MRQTRLFALAMALFAVPASLPAQTPGESSTPPGALNTWTFSTDTANNLMIQDLSSFQTSQGTAVGDAICLQFAAPCPTDSVRTRRRYLLRNKRERGAEWRVELGDLIFQNGGMTLPLQVGVGEKGAIQIISSPGSWNVEMRRIPMVELRAGEGKKWNVSLTLTSDTSGQGCWIEVQCPGGG